MSSGKELKRSRALAAEFVRRVLCCIASASLPAYVTTRQHTSAYVSIRQHTSAYAIIRQYVSIRQHIRLRWCVISHHLCCPFSTIYVSSYCYKCVLLLLYMRAPGVLLRVSHAAHVC
jgi:hypothetical protein